MKKIRIFRLLSLLLALVFMEAFASASPEIKASLSMDKISFDQSTVLKLEVPEELKLGMDKITIDASELGYEKEIDMDLALLETTLSPKGKIEAGKKTIKVNSEMDGKKSPLAQVSLELVNESPKDFSWDQAIIYFMLTDRFNNGDQSNDDPLNQAYDKNHLESYNGGDFKGLIDKLDYLKDLGVNTIWITPIVDNIEWNLMNGKGTQYGYHGYWAKDFTKIDEHLGDLDTFKKLLDGAHDRGMKVMVDVVINHTGYGLKMSDIGKDIPNYPTAEDKNRFKDMLRLSPKNGDLVTGELAGLPDFITEDHAVREKVIGWQKDWLEKARTEKGTIDFFRVDTVKHVDPTTLRYFKNEIIKLKPDFKMIGEFFDGNVNVNGNLLDPSMMDSVLDFDFKKIAKDYTRGKFEEAEKKLANRNKKIDNTTTTGQFLSSHDEDGFLAVRLSGDTGLFKVASALQLTAKGQPVIYYGEEIGMSGKNAGDFSKGEFGENRYRFDWSKVDNNPMLAHYKKLLKIRNDNTGIFTQGQRKALASDKKLGLSVFERFLDQDHIIVALNIKDTKSSYELKTGLEKGQKIQDLYTGKEYEVKEGGLVEIEVPDKDSGATSIIKLKGTAEAKLLSKEETKTQGEKPQEDTKKADTMEILKSIFPIILVLAISILFFKSRSKNK